MNLYDKTTNKNAVNYPLSDPDQRLAFYFTKHLAHRHDYEDIIAVAIDGVRHAQTKFDESKGHKFSVYAKWWIRSKVSIYLAKMGGPVKIPTLKSQKGTHATGINLEDALKYSNLETQMSKINNDFVYQDMLKHLMYRLDEYAKLKTYGERNKQIFILYYFKNMTLREVAEEVGITTERVRQILKKIVDKFKPEFKGLLDR